MSEVRPDPVDPRDPAADEALLADLFDRLLEDVLEERAPDLDAILPERPDLRPRVEATWRLVCSVAGRREPGAPMLGGYQIVRELGRGGMGTVYLARHQQLDREVAIKVLPHSLALSPRSKQRFLAEARALARIRHDHVVHVHRIVDTDDLLAFEMEYIDGPSLQHLLLQLRAYGTTPTLAQLAANLQLPAAQLGARSPIEFFVRVGIAIARALAVVHAHGLVHRDVKPANILLRADGKPVLADFGLVRDGDPSLTQSGAFAGTPIYAAPERLRDGDLASDARADIYSLGVTLYEAMSLTPPYQGRSTGEVLRRIENGSVQPLRKLAPHVPADLQTVLAKAMEPEPADRYATAAEFADDLERLLALQPIHARPAGPLRRLAKAARRHRRVLLAAATGAVLVMLGLWPWVAEARGNEAARARAAAWLHTARLRLLAPDCQQFAWLQPEPDARVGTDQGPLDRQRQALAAALAAYDEALRLGPAVADARLERAVVAAALGLRSGQPIAADAALPPLTRSAAQDWLAGKVDGVQLGRQVDSATPPDRFALGLLALLLGDSRICAACWDAPAGNPGDHPLVGAGLGLALAAEGFPERAFPRLFHATSEFPEATGVSFALADAAVAMGDVQMAKDWLQNHQAAAGSEARARRLQADVAAATGQLDVAEAAYRELLRAEPADVITRHRLAQLTMTRGDRATARAHLLAIVRLAPENARAHLDLARLALQDGDRTAYLAEARHVLGQDLVHGHSLGAARHLLEILRLGGLQSLHDETAAAAGIAVVQNLRSAPSVPLPCAPPARLPGIVDALRLLRTWDHALAVARANQVLPAAQQLQALFRTGQHLPALLLRLPPAVAALLFTAERPVLQLAPLLVPALMPFERVLGDRLEFLDGGLLLGTDAEPELLFGQSLVGLGSDPAEQRLLVGVTPTGSRGPAGRVEVRTVDGRLEATLAAEHDDSIFGFSLAAIGDTDGDGIDDYVVGAPLRRRDQGQAGSVLCFAGRDHRRRFEVNGDGVGFGVAVAGLGDVDGDGVPDFAVGNSPDRLSTTALGGASIHSGRDGRCLRPLPPDRAGVWFGATLAAAGDLDGDGVTDLVVAGNHGGAAGLVRVYSGRSGQVLQTLVGEDPEDEFGRRAIGAGDVDGDGCPDLLVSATRSAAGRQPGTVTVFSGRTGARLAALDGDSAGDGFGFWLTVLPGWHGPGRTAIAVTAVRGGPFGCGYVRVFDQRTLRPLRSYFTPPGHEAFGFALAAVADPDRPGRSLLLAPSRHADDRGMLWRFRAGRQEERLR